VSLGAGNRTTFHLGSSLLSVSWGGRRACSSPRLPPLAGCWLCWLLRTSVQKIDMLRTIEQASLPKPVKCEYNQRGLFCSYSSSNVPIFTKERFHSCFICSSQSSNEFVSAFTRSKNVFRGGSNHRHPHFCSERSPMEPDANPNCLRKTHCYDTN
jgi:hypothetical protein